MFNFANPLAFSHMACRKSHYLISFVPWFSMIFHDFPWFSHIILQSYWFVGADFWFRISQQKAWRRTSARCRNCWKKLSMAPSDTRCSNWYGWFLSPKPGRHGLKSPVIPIDVFYILHTYTHTHIYIYIRTHTHTYIYIYIHTYNFFAGLLCPDGWWKNKPRQPSSPSQAMDSTSGRTQDDQREGLKVQKHKPRLAGPIRDAVNWSECGFQVMKFRLAFWGPFQTEPVAMIFGCTFEQWSQGLLRKLVTDRWPVFG